MTQAPQSGSARKKYELSYPVATVDWDGKRIRALPEAAIRQSLEALRRGGIGWVMLTGYHVEEPAACDLDEETARLGRELAALGMKAAQHHGLCATLAPLDGPQDEAVAHLGVVLETVKVVGEAEVGGHAPRHRATETSDGLRGRAYSVEPASHRVAKVELLPDLCKPPVSPKYTPPVVDQEVVERRPPG